MTMKHAPGPWEWSENLLVSQTKPHDIVVRMHATFRPLAANAHLIAAAPDLLAACEEALLAMDAIDVGTSEVSLALRNAIAKAKGQEP